jgi:nucleoside 2-deoxyribosyltransferase
MIRAYLAGPDVFFSDAAAFAARKKAICARYGIEGRAPADLDVLLSAAPGDDVLWRRIFAADITMMESCDITIANLTPYAGASADSGTLVEVGWFLGRGRPIFGYSNTATLFTERLRAQFVREGAGGDLRLEDFGLPDNLMIPGAVEQAGGLPLFIPQDGRDLPHDALDVFERCVAAAAKKLNP